MTDSHADPDAFVDPSVEMGRLERRAARERVARKEAERLLEAKSRELWEERERYRVLVENSSDVVATADMAGLITWISDSVTAMLGWTPPELVGTSIASLLHPDDLPLYLSLRPQRERGEDLRYEARMRTRHGAWPWMSIQSRQILDDRGNPSHRVAGWRDVTAEREAREALAESREIMLASAEGMLEPQVLCAAVRDESGRIVDFTYVMANWAARQHFAMGEDLIGASMLATLPALAESGLLSTYAAVVETGEPFSQDDFWFRDDRLDMQAYYDLRANAVPGDRLSLAWRNVTERHAAARRLEESEERLRATLDAMLDPHVVLEAVRDDTGRIVDFVFLDANAAAAEFNGLSRDDLIGVPLLGQHPAAGTTTLFEDYVRVVETGEPIIRDDWSYPQDMLGGELRRYDVRAVKFRDGLSQTWRDVTDRYEAGRRVAESEERYRLLADNATDIIFRLRHSLITWVSPSVTTVLGGEPQEWIGQNWADLIHPDDMEAAAAALPDLLETGTGLYRARIRAADGTYHWAEAHIGTYVRSGGEPDGWIVSTRIIDEQVAAEQKLERLARLDSLTGVMNRGEAMTRLQAIIANERSPGRELAVIFCDVDRFKDINDTHGHAAGDAVLVELTRRITDSIRREDLVARMGGDEILVLLADTHGQDEALRIAEKIRQRVVEPITVDGQALSVTLSIGVSVLIPGEEPDALIARADQAMYEAKRLGRDRVIAI
jgi:diguanylate cyclase (GGDEF)-like protein/PAS domain S-box-containing protein